MDKRLEQAKYFSGEEYSIADIAIYPWLRAYKWQGQDLNDWPNIQRWYSDIRSRPAVQRGLAVLAEKVDRSGNRPSGERWENLFGSGQFPSPKENK
jgi:GST-like protein